MYLILNKLDSSEITYFFQRYRDELNQSSLQPRMFQLKAANDASSKHRASASPLYFANIFPAVTWEQLQLGRMGAGRMEEMKNLKRKTGFHEVKAGGVCGWVREQASVNIWHWQLLLEYIGICKERGRTAARVLPKATALWKKKESNGLVREGAKEQS